METTMIPKAIIFTILYDHICAYNVYFIPYILFVLYMWWIFCHDRIAFLRKDEFLMPFTNRCNYRVLIVVWWVFQSKVPTSIIMNSVSVRHS
jgi:hypothetical protein